MLVIRHRRFVRTAVLAIALVMLAAQVAWARAAVCGSALEAHAACKCCEERERTPGPAIAAECCAVEESTHTAAAPRAVAAIPSPALVATLPPVVIVDAPVGAPAAGVRAAIEARCAGPPLWLRLRSLRL